MKSPLFSPPLTTLVTTRSPTPVFVRVSARTFGVPTGCHPKLIGAGLGIGRIGGQAVEAIARQPEASADIRGAMILTAALVEGATLAALVFALLFKLA